jgi:hypothetical protein
VVIVLALGAYGGRCSVVIRPLGGGRPFSAQLVTVRTVKHEGTGQVQATMTVPAKPRPGAKGMVAAVPAMNYGSASTTGTVPKSQRPGPGKCWLHIIGHDRIGGARAATATTAGPGWTHPRVLHRHLTTHQDTPNRAAASAPCQRRFSCRP